MSNISPSKSYARPTNANAENFKEFDFVIIGGGTSGLTCAATLAKENPKCTVGVLEAGSWRPNDPMIDVPSKNAQGIFNPDYDWCLMSVPQSNCNDRQLVLPRGKMLGGSSALNFLCWQRGYRSDFDDIAKLGNPGWDWDSLTADYHQLTKASNVELTKVQIDNGSNVDLLVHGDKGLVDISHGTWFSETQNAWAEMLKGKGLKVVKDGSGGGEINGYWNTYLTIDDQTHKRVYAGKVFYEKNGYSQLDNYKVLTEARVTKIEFDQNVKLKSSKNVTLRANGAAFLHEGKEYFVKAKREVIVSAGTYLSPQILELSGVGDEKILQKHEIPIQLKNENVGKNYQEHLMVGTVFTAKEDLITFDKLRNSEYAEKAKKFYSNPKEDTTGGIMATSLATGFGYFPLEGLLTSTEFEDLKKLARDNVDQANWNEGMKRGLELQMAKLFDAQGPAMEMTFSPGFAGGDGTPKENTAYLSQLTLNQYPLSRGSVHIQSNKPTEQPAIDLNAFSNPADLRLMAIALRQSVENIEKDEKLASFIVDRHCPNKETCKTLEDYENYLKDYVGVTFHPVGTCSMMPKEQGGVVDAQLRVYGTQNVRVADASILPIMPAGHIQAACYTIGHKAARMISQTI